MNPSSENPFSDAGCILSGQRVIGRAREIQYLRDKLCAKSGHGSIALIGMPRIGKSSLVQRAILDEAPALARDKIVCTRIDVGTLGSFHDLLDAMVRDTLAEIRKFDLSVERVESLAAQVFAAAQDSRWRTTRGFFGALRSLQIRPICVLDEFDATRRLLHGDVQCFLRLRDLAAAPATDCKVGLVLVCKRSLAELSELAGLQHNYWHNAVGTELNLRGFDEPELDCYFAVLKQAGVSLPKSARDELLRLCGPHPYLLDLFASEAFPLAKTGNAIDPVKCRELMAPHLPKAFSQLVEALKDGPWLSKLKGVLLDGAPRTSLAELQTLIRYGVLINAGDGKVLPFASTLPEYLRSLSDNPGSTPAPLQEAKEAATQLPPQESHTTSSSPAQNCFCRKGGGWDLCFEKRKCVAPHTDGFSYIAKLLRSQPNPVNFAELRLEVHKSDIGTFTKPTSAADAKTLCNLRKEIEEVQDEVDAAISTNNSEAGARAQQRLEELKKNEKSLTFRGRSRTLGDHDKTVMNSVGNAITKAIDLLKKPEYHPQLAKHLRSNILPRYGANPRYAPSPKVAWQVTQ